MRLRFKIFPMILALIVPSCSVFFSSNERQDFVRVRGTHFIVNGAPYYFAGTNLWYGCYLGSPGETGNRPRLLRELDSLRAIGIINLRILAASEEASGGHSITPAITRFPGSYNDSLLQGLDFLLAEMAKRKMLGVLFLNNFWDWTGGMAQYNVWAGAGSAGDRESPENALGGLMTFAADFYANEKANGHFRDYVRFLVNRRNTVNNRIYRDDPTIMAWQLANEPRPGTDGPSGERTLESFYRWIDQTAGFIHSLDTNHLVSTGSEGAVGFRWSNEYALKSHASPNINYVTFHLWPKNWSWFDPARFEETLPASEEKALAYVRDNIAIARTLNKPITLEEFGLARDSARVAPGTPTTARDRYFALILSALTDSAAGGSPFSGWNVWAWGGHEHGRQTDGSWRPGDPLLGDPPQEPQGFNSIFIEDRSTVALLREQATRINALRTSDTTYVTR